MLNATFLKAKIKRSCKLKSVVAFNLVATIDANIDDKMF